jgi:hypothetical protein
MIALSYNNLLVFLLFIALSQQNLITFRIIQSSALHFLPIIKLHHIVLLSDNPKKYVYTLDFTPINQTHTDTLLKLLFAQNVTAEVRLRYIETNIENKEFIIQKWSDMNKVDEDASYQLSKRVYSKIYNKKIRNIISASFMWLPYMNLYDHNCQHFSKYVKKFM